MKTTIKAALVGAIVASGSLIAISPLFSLKAQAEVAGGVERYTVISADRFDQPGNDALLEAELNRLGEQGWKVRMAFGTKIVLAK